MTQNQNPVRERILALAEHLKDPWFPREDDVPWQQWVDFRHRSLRDLIDLLKEDIRCSLKARALFLCLIPHYSCSPFYWKEFEELDIVPNHTDFLRSLSANLLRFTLELAVEFRSILTENKDLIKRKSSGGSEYDTFYFFCHMAIFQYDKYLLELLALFQDKDDKEIVFGHYYLFEPIAYNVADWASCGPDHSRYEPFERLLERTDIEKEWKYRADFKMREIILDEICGMREPREKWEDALTCYKMILSSQSFGRQEGKEDYSKRLFVKQVEFLVSQAMVAARYELIDSFSLERFFSLLTGNRYKETRYQLAQYFIQQKLDLYCDRCGFQLANMILAEFGKKHEDIRIVLEDAMGKRRETIAKIEKRDQECQKSEDSILDQMK